MPSSEPKVRELLSAAAIRARVAEMGAKITRDYAGGDLLLVGVLKGSFVFMADLCRAIDLPLSVEFLGLQSYGDQTESSGVVQITADLTRPVEGKDVLIVEDIVDTGLTMDYLLENLRLRLPRTVKIAALLHKPDRMIRKVAIDYLGFTIPDAFVVGYGLDYSQLHRNLPYIGVLERGEE
ncbi:MAG TPA: hypoxanthine phosphoribosyltransferase [Polyangia bacterium]|nr:hypoxanthine phosphoribosyltransferase [Polyangia bacterium]